MESIKNRFNPVSSGQLVKDLLGGVIVALISIPISMGYAQIAGLPMQYGLYGSVFTIIIFGLLTTSRDFVFGVDAAPAALVGGTVAAMGYAAGSEEALHFVLTLTFFVSLWLLIFFLFKAGRIVKYISASVMGGFVTGICCTIILMQTPKLFGGSPGAGEASELILHIISQLPEFNLLSFGLSAASIAIIMIAKKFIPKVPMSVIVMAAAAVSGMILPFESYGVRLLPHVDAGFHGFAMLPVIESADQLRDYLFSSLSIAAVILAESLLASRGNALKDGYKLDSNREILAYSAANFMSALSCCCPVNASVSRTGIVRQFGAKSQWLSISSGITMLAVLYFAAPMIEYLPVPVLTAIVVSALINACEFGEAVYYFKKSRTEFYIFVGAFLAVLIFGTVYGVIIGVVLSFVSVIMRAVTPPRAFLGAIEGKQNSFYSLKRNKESRAVKNTIIYRFGGDLFFANIDTLQNDIETAIREDTKVVIINAGACGAIDITAAERLLMMYEELKKRGIHFYITEHVEEVNDQLRQFGAGKLLESGAVRMTTALALRDSGIRYPYPIEDESVTYILTGEKTTFRKKRFEKSIVRPAYISRMAKGIQPELEWVFGSKAEEYREKIAQELVDKFFDSSVTLSELEDAEKHTLWGRVNMFDEDEILDRIENKLEEELAKDPEKLAKAEKVIHDRREYIEQRIRTMDPGAIRKLIDRRKSFLESAGKKAEDE